MWSRRGKEGLLLAVFWVVANALIGTAANRLILHGPLGGTLLHHVLSSGRPFKP